MGNITLKALEFEGMCRQLNQMALEINKMLVSGMEIEDMWAQWSEFMKLYEKARDGLLALKNEVRNCVEKNLWLLDV